MNNGIGRKDPLTRAAPRKHIRYTRVVRATGRVARQRRLTHDTWELVIRRDVSTSRLFPEAGQFATLKVAGIDQARAYSFACDPDSEADREHSFIIRTVPGGEMSGWLSGERVGAAVEIAGPLGRFVLDDATKTLVLVAGGSGLSAIKALAEQAAHQQLARDGIVLWGVCTARDLHSVDAFAKIADSWNAAYRFEFRAVLSDEPHSSTWTGARGLVGDYLEENYLATGALAPGSFRTWLCGPPPMIQACTAMLSRAGVDQVDIYQDVFADRSAPAPVIDNRRCVLCDECLLVRPVAECIVETGALSTDHRGNIVDFEPLVPLRSPGLYYNALVVDANACIRCAACVNACPHGAISDQFAFYRRKE